MGVTCLPDFSVPVTRVETNLKEIVGRWEYEYAAAVASVLHQFDTVANVGLLASGGEHPTAPSFRLVQTRSPIGYCRVTTLD